MILLASTSDLIRLVTSAAASLDVHASFVDLNGSTVTPGRTNTQISTATTTTVVASPGSSTYRTLKTLTARNRHATTATDVTVLHSDGSTVVEIVKAYLAAGEALHYHEAAGFWVADASGKPKSAQTLGSLAPAVNELNTVVLASDVVNNNATANTIADVTGLSFAVNSGETYWFRFVIPYTSAATTTGSRWSINGPPSPTLLHYLSRYTINATSGTTNYATAYDTPAAANASSLTSGNIAEIEGLITPSASGDVIARFASEVSASAITAKAGALLQWMRVI